MGKSGKKRVGKASGRSPHAVTNNSHRNLIIIIIIIIVALKKYKIQQVLERTLGITYCGKKLFGI